MEYGEELKNRKVLVTGANGFVGSHLVDSLVKHGSDVLAFVRSTHKGKCSNLDHSNDNVEVFYGELQDPVSVREGVSRLLGYDDVLIFHLGAQAHVGQSWDKPYETVQTNLVGTLNLLEAIRELDIDVEKFNTAGTSEEYGNFDSERSQNYRETEQEVILDEKAPINPESVYGTSKVAADFITQNYYDAYGIPTITTRMFNNYGPRQSTDFITGTVVAQALENDVLELGNLEPKRDMCFVKDGVRGHLHATIEGNPGEVYNFGYGENLSMKKWVQKIINIGQEEGFWGNIEIVQTDERFRPGNSEVKDLKAESKKLNDLTGWEPRIGWNEGIARTIRWYAENKDLPNSSKRL